MRFRLTHKILAINVGIILALTMSLIGFSYVVSKSLYSNALNGIDLSVMENLAPTLAEQYRADKNWNRYISNQSEWNDTVNHSFYTVFFSLMEKTAKNALDHEKRQAPIPTPPPKSTPAWDMPFGTFLQRVTLLDAQKNPLIHPQINKSEVNYQVIKLDGRIIGWLSIGKIDMDILPLAGYFFEQQVRLVNWVMALGGILAALLSLIMSRQITRPLHQLTAGAEQIARRNFGARININSHDEFQELAERFNAVSTELAHHQTLQKQWLTDISHELKTPLTLLVAEIFAICDNLTQCDENTANFLQAEVLHVKRLVDDLYELSKSDELGFNLNLQTLDMQPFVEHLLAPYKPLFTNKNIVLEARYPNEQVYLRADADRLTQVMRNLLENCLRYMNAPGTLKVLLVHRKPGLSITFADSGPGVAAEVAQTLFDRLYRADTLGGRSAGGAGVGLAICKAIVSAHGGDISATPNDSGGLSICISFPS